MKAFSIYHTYLNKGFYEYTGKLYNKNILNLLQFLKCHMDCSFDEIEKNSGTTPYKQGNDRLKSTFLWLMEFTLHVGILMGLSKNWLSRTIDKRVLGKLLHI